MIASWLLMRNAALLALILPVFSSVPANAGDLGSPVDVVITKEVSKTKKETPLKNIKDERIEVVEVVAIRNRSSRPLSKLDVSVTIVVITEGDRIKTTMTKPRLEHFRIENLETGQEHVIHCQPISLQKYSSQNTTKSGGSVGGKFENRIRKVTVTVAEAGKEIWATK